MSRVQLFITSDSHHGKPAAFLRKVTTTKYWDYISDPNNNWGSVDPIKNDVENIRTKLKWIYTNCTRRYKMVHETHQALPISYWGDALKFTIHYCEFKNDSDAVMFNLLFGSK